MTQRYAIGAPFGALGGFKPPPPPKAPVGQMQRGIASNIALSPAATQLQTPPMMQSGYDFSADPALQRIVAVDAAARSNAEAAAMTAEKQLAIQLGDATGIIKDGTTAKEAANNPYSTLASLGKAYKQTEWNTDQSANQNNLFYSGARAKQVAGDADTYQHQQYDARTAAMNALATIQENLAAAENTANANDAAGYQSAYTTAANNAATYGYDPGGNTQQTPLQLNPNRTANVAGALAAAPSNPYPQALAASPAFRSLMANRYAKVA